MFTCNYDTFIHTHVLTIDVEIVSVAYWYVTLFSSKLTPRLIPTISVTWIISDLEHEVAGSYCYSYDYNFYHYCNGYCSYVYNTCEETGYIGSLYVKKV